MNSALYLIKVEMRASKKEKEKANIENVVTQKISPIQTYTKSFDIKNYVVSKFYYIKVQYCDKLSK